jgi:hypothetical protein
MSKPPPRSRARDAAPYAPPAAEVLGTVADLTAGAGGNITDSCNTGQFTVSHQNPAGGG